MRAALVRALDGPQSVAVTEVADPVRGSDQVLIEVHAAGVAFPDVLLTRGQYQYRPDPPFVPGSEVAGVVVSAPDHSGFSPGDRVAALTALGGGMAEQAVVAPEAVFRLPEGVPFAAGAGLLFNDLTVHFALRTRGRLAAGETVLVHGAAGGIGTSTLRLARVLGAARTIAVVSDEAKAQTARRAGADEVVLVDGWLARVKDLTGGRGVDVVLDPVGGDRFTDSLRALARGGRLLVVGFTGGEIPTVRVNRLLLNNVEVVGAGWGAWFLSDPTYLAQQWAEIGPLLQSGALTAPDPTVYRFDDVAAAISALETRTALGKVVLAVR